MNSSSKPVPESLATATRDDTPCLICAAPRLLPLTEFGTLPRITSDCRAFPSGGRLAVCGACGGVQKYADAKWLGEIGTIYAGYAAYFQADGDEQVIMDSRTGSVRRRSDVIVERLFESKRLPASGKALDIGCGSGVTLSAISKQFTDWRLYGQDLDDRNKVRLEGVDGFEKLFVCKPEEIEGRFDLITLIHSLEHFPEPGGLLVKLRKKLTHDGVLLVQVCDTVRNPYDLLIADHLTHFSADTLRLLAENSGLSVVAVETEWVGKELSMVATNDTGQGIGRSGGSRNGQEALDRVRTQLKWMAAMAKEAGDHASTTKDFGIFGTSICATWLAALLGDRVGFFVDEDPSRQGKKFMGKPILRPGEVKSGSKIYMALVPEIAERISQRLRPLSLQLIQPPVFGVSS